MAPIDKDRTASRLNSENYRARQRAAGRKAVTFWLTDEERAYAKSLVKAMRAGEYDYILNQYRQND